jgi:hypothetical protein
MDIDGDICNNLFDDLPAGASRRPDSWIFRAFALGLLQRGKKFSLLQVQQIRRV